MNKIKDEKIKEVIFALSTTMERDTTNFYIYRKISDLNVITSTIARGVSVGDNLEYTDEVTLGRSISERIPFIECCTTQNEKSRNQTMSMVLQIHEKNDLSNALQR